MQHHKIYALLKDKKLISYSIRDFIEYFADVKKVKINNEWMIEPIIAEQKKLLQQTGLLFRKKKRYGLRKYLLFSFKKFNSIVQDSFKKIPD